MAQPGLAQFPRQVDTAGTRAQLRRGEARPSSSPPPPAPCLSVLLIPFARASGAHLPLVYPLVCPGVLYLPTPFLIIVVLLLDSSAHAALIKATLPSLASQKVRGQTLACRRLLPESNTPVANPSRFGASPRFHRPPSHLVHPTTVSRTCFFNASFLTRTVASISRQDAGAERGGG